MKWIKPILYVVLVSLVVWSLTGFVRSMRSSQGDAASRLEKQESSANPVTPTPPPSTPSEGTTTNAATNATASLTPAPTPAPKSTQGNMVAYLLTFLASAAALGVLLSRDVNRWMADTAEDLLLNDDVDKSKNPDYEHAEKVWADGQYLEAISLLRDFLKRHPREIYAAIRIAEIYESDLQNHLAAALEYEEVLKHKFSAEKWGWAAIHLVNIYTGKLDKHDEAMAWLKRIVTEVPQSSAAKKARERLAAMDIHVDVPGSGASVAGSPAASEPEPPSHLPKGFRPKN